MDSFELNKILGAVLGTCLVLLVTSFAAHAIVRARELPEKPGFEIAVKEDAAPAASKEALPRPSEPIEKLLPDRLRREGRGRRQEVRAPATPSRRAAPTASARTSMASSTSRRGARAAAGSTSRRAMKGKGGTWTFDDLNKFIANPKGFVPGTAMGFAGIPKDSERADVIAYLNSLSDNPAAAADRVEVISRRFQAGSCDLATTRPG